MATAPKVGMEATHGIVASNLYSLPGDFSAKLAHDVIVYDENRNSQDENYSAQAGVQHETWAYADSPFYHDRSGLLLAAALGAPTKTVVESGAVWDNVFKLGNDPKSLSFQWLQRWQSVQAFQSVYAVADKLTFKFTTDGLILISASGLALPETEIADPTHSFTTTIPLAAWRGDVTLQGGASDILVSGTINVARNRKPFRSISNTQAPARFTAGARMVDFDLTLDFPDKDVLDDFKSATTDALTVATADSSVTIGASSHPSLAVKLGKIVYKEAEIDDGSDTPLLKVKGRALYFPSDASPIVATIRSSADYTAL